MCCPLCMVHELTPHDTHQILNPNSSAYLPLPRFQSKMPAGRPAIDLDEFKDLIREAWQTGLPVAAILSLLNNELAVQGQPCGIRTLERRLAQWQFEKRYTRLS